MIETECTIKEKEEEKNKNQLSLQTFQLHLPPLVQTTANPQWVHPQDLHQHHI